MQYPLRGIKQGVNCVCVQNAEESMGVSCQHRDGM